MKEEEFFPAYIFILDFTGLMSDLPDSERKGGKGPFLLGSLLYTWYKHVQDVKTETKSNLFHQ